MSAVVHTPREVKRARYAVAAVFAVHGAVTGSFATRVPWIQDHAGVSAGQLGLALAFPALGASLAMPLAGGISHRFGARNALRGLLALWTLALILPSLAPNLLTLCLALFVYGASAGMSDVAMNALGVEVENRLDRSIMSGLHGMWSVGAVVGSAAGTLAAHLGSDARLHHALAAAVLTVVGFAACAWVLDLQPAEDEEPPPRFALPPRSALLIGAIGFCAVFAEGASLDWSAVYLRDQLETSAGLAAACTTGFTLTMAVARIAGDRVVDRYGAVRTVRASGVLALLGGLLIVFAGHPAVAMTGFALMGLGIAVVVPLCFAAAGRSGSNPSLAIAGVATITYTSGLVAPSAIGMLAQATSLMVSFVLVTLLTCGIAGFAGVLRAGDRLKVTRPDAAVPEPRP
ncbi:MFS transporter [Streptomyces cellulosae]|jgi:MFS family permease|uniref:MFS family permease n=1 Tax=Streptomyces thermodiastaticus TaxID=44061 RepID=A0ABU0KMX7_9ACTN|nr:MFS transporter [Streptomyces sp. McG7]MBT2907331.1 MFS transporter [Streptomyces sp. McG8]MCX4475877.1 MFS transporter [Streptomyces cellulosae]MDQ0490710.1 MFS family permease [Streptomyces thermodiastaticus]MDX3414038.1 MFS transporter [Streptomyces sp. MD20-1-1]MXQ60475.1 MFS transporter [Streptomyces sp. XHT-2]MYW55983.1 MFS transporter [Streptomyces sp. SID8376]THC58150.1 MFS transporter [Streptomyces sp. Akac8]UVT08711.1 MFS transporter [Streptomyces thermocarboxydus]